MLSVIKLGIILSVIRWRGGDYARSLSKQVVDDSAHECQLPGMLRSLGTAGEYMSADQHCDLCHTFTMT